MAEENKFTELKSTLIKARTAEAVDPSKICLLYTSDAADE